MVRTFWKQITSTLFWHDSRIATLLVIIIFSNIVCWFMVGQAEQTGAFLPWHYSVYFGIDRVGRWWQLTLYPMIATGTMLVNIVLANILYFRRRHLSYVLFFVTILIQWILLFEVLYLVLFII